MNTQKRDILILELIKYLIEGDKSLATQVTDLLNEPQGTHGNAGQVGRELQSLKNSIHELKTEVKKINQVNRGTTVSSSKTHKTSSSLNNGSNGNNGLYQDIVKDALQNAEYRMQTLAKGTFLAKGNFHNIFLWSSETPKGVCIVLLESQTDSISDNVLNVLAGQVAGEIPKDIQSVADVARLFNKKIFNFYNKYKNIEQNVVASFVLVDKRSAKVFFTGAGTNLFRVDTEGKMQINKGLETPLGIPQNQFTTQSVDIKRGEGIYVSSQKQLAKIATKVKDETSIEKKKQLDEWLKKQRKNSAILGLSF